MGVVCLGIALVGILTGLLIAANLVDHQNAGGVSSQTYWTGTGGTNTSSTVNTTSTQILPSTWSLFARISNYGTSTVSCYADNKTAASSSAATNAGINIGMVSSTFSGESSVCFGPSSGCIPFVGAVNCISSQKATVGLTYY